MDAFDFHVSFPSPGLIQLRSKALFANAESVDCRRFLERVFLESAIASVTIRDDAEATATLAYYARTTTRDAVVSRIASLLRADLPRNPEPMRLGDQLKPIALRVANAATARDPRGVVRYFRSGANVTGWEVQRDHSGRLRTRNRAIARRTELCRSVEAQLRNTLGVESARVNSLTGTASVDYDLDGITGSEIVELLDAAIGEVPQTSKRDRPNVHLPICTAALPLAAAAQFAFPPLLPLATATLAYAAIPSFQAARHAFSGENRRGTELLDAAVLAGCLATLSVFPGTLLCWCMSLSRVLTEKSRADSKSLLLSGHGTRPRFVWLYRDGVEVQVPLDRVRDGDLVVVNSGDTVPFDGHVADGFASVEPFSLGGESLAVEKGVGDRVFASSRIAAGKLILSVESPAEETASARVRHILEHASEGTLATERRTNRFAQQAVFPTLALSALGWSAVGASGALAILKTDFAAGFRGAAPLATTATLAQCARRGILVSNLEALDRLPHVDTVVFDQSALLDRDRPEVDQIIALPGFSARGILTLAAAAEQPFHHPVARAILAEAAATGVDIPNADEISYAVGSGLAARVEGKLVRVGTARFLGVEPSELPPHLANAQARAERDGHRMLFVSRDGKLAGAIELRSPVRNELRASLQKLRGQGVRQLVAIAPRDEKALSELTEALRIDRGFPEISSSETKGVLETLKREGAKVCYISADESDPQTAAAADVSIRFGDGSTIATDACQALILGDQGDAFVELHRLATELARNVSRSRMLVVVPSLACLAGVFTAGLGLGASVVVTNLAALAALANGMLPFRKVAQDEAERRHRLELSKSHGLERNPLHTQAAAADRRDDPHSDQQRVLAASA